MLATSIFFKEHALKELKSYVKSFVAMDKQHHIYALTFRNEILSRSCCLEVH